MNKTTSDQARYFRPKPGSDAEYTFYPTKKFRDAHCSNEPDVGFFLHETEVLVLEALKQPRNGKYGDIVFPIAEGKISIRIEEWNEISEDSANSLKANGTVEFHSIDDITREYLTD